MRFPLRPKNTTFVVHDTLAERIVQIEQESARYNVEQDLFLTGQVKGNVAELTGYLSSERLYSPALFITLPEEGYVQGGIPEFYPKLKELTDKLYRGYGYPFFFYGGALKRMFQDMSQCQLFKRDGEEVKPVREIAFPPCAVYSPESVWRGPLIKSFDKKGINELVKNRVIGYFHTHLHYLPDTPNVFSQEDVDVAIQLKRAVNAKRFVIGVSGEAKKHHYLVI